MACVSPTGQLSDLARKALDAVAAGADEAGVARTLGVPLYRVRASLRELTEGGLLTQDGNQHSVSPAGEAARRA